MVRRKKLEHAPPFIPLLSSILIYILFSNGAKEQLGYFHHRLLFPYSFPWPHRLSIDRSTNPRIGSDRDSSSRTRRFYSTARGGSKGWNMHGRKERTVFTVNEILRDIVSLKFEKVVNPWFNFTIDNGKLRFVSSSVKARLKRRTREYVHARMLR